MAKKISTPTEDGSFKTKGKSADEILDEVESEFKGVSFDAIDVTQKVIKFGQALTGVPLYNYQYLIVFRIIYAIITMENVTITIIVSRQAGKTESLAFAVNTLSVILPTLAKMFPDLDQFKDGIKIGLFAPQSDQVFTTYNRALLRLSSENAQMIMGDADLGVELEKPNKYSLSNGSFMMGQVASKQSKIESKTYDLVLIEEAQDVDSYIVQKSIEPMVSSTGGTIIKCGTTGTAKTDYYNEIIYNRSKSRTIKDSRLHLHLEFDYKKVCADKRKQYDVDSKVLHLHYERDVQKKMLKWGKDSQVFKLSYALIWDLESGMLVSDAEFKKVCNLKKGLGNFNENDVIIAGLDIAKDIASTVITFCKVVFEPDMEGERLKKEIIGWFEMPSGTDYETQHHIIVEKLVEYGVRSLYVDYTGVGKPVVDRLNYSVGEWIQITPYGFSKSSKSDMWFNLIEHFQTGKVVIPSNKVSQGTEEWQRFQEQLLNCQKWYDGAYICAEKSDGFLDDYVDSLGLCLMADNFQVSEEIEQEPFNPFFDNIQDSRTLHKKLSH